jgi:hypothetical protein
MIFYSKEIADLPQLVHYAGVPLFLTLSYSLNSFYVYSWDCAPRWGQSSHLCLSGIPRANPSGLEPVSRVFPQPLARLPSYIIWWHLWQ